MKYEQERQVKTLDDKGLAPSHPSSVGIVGPIGCAFPSEHSELKRITRRADSAPRHSTWREMKGRGRGTTRVQAGPRAATSTCAAEADSTERRRSAESSSIDLFRAQANWASHCRGIQELFAFAKRFVVARRGGLERDMAEPMAVSTVDHTKGAESATSGAATTDVRREIVHENADDKAPSVMQRATETVAQGVQKAKDAVVGKADLGHAPSAQAAPITDHQSRV